MDVRILSFLFTVQLISVGCAEQSAPGAEAQTYEPALASEATVGKRAALRASNVVLVTIDTLRGDILGFMDGPARTPVLDELASTGLVFENAIAAAMLTTPAHASIMTSLYPTDHGVYDNQSGIADSIPTLAEAFAAQGYQTIAVIGFPHLNPEVSNLGKGFQHIVRAGRQRRRATDTTAEAIAALEHIQPGKFFMWLHYTDPHAPYDPPESHPPRPVQQSAPTPMSRVVKAAPGFQRSNAWFQQAFTEHRFAEDLEARYVAEVESSDAALGDLMRGMHDLGVADTALLITADHGENLGERDLYFHHGGLYRETVHVPLIIASVDGKFWGRRLSDLVSHVDIAPTLLQLAGLHALPQIRGRSLVPLSQGKSMPERVVFSEHVRAQLVSVRSGEATLIYHRKSAQQFPSYPFIRGEREFYDTLLDPHERRHLPLHGPTAAALERALQEYLRPSRRYSPRLPTGQDQESLRALGYIQ